jgi:hypothetical protein
MEVGAIRQPPLLMKLNGDGRCYMPASTKGLMEHFNGGGQLYNARLQSNFSILKKASEFCFGFEFKLYFHTQTHI